MKLLLLLSLVSLAVGQEIVPKPVESNNVPSYEGVLQAPQETAELADDKKVDKRSHGWSQWILPSHDHGWSHGLPLYTISHGHGHGWHGSSGHGHGSIGWTLTPIYISSGHGWHGSGHGGWHSKW